MILRGGNSIHVVYPAHNFNITATLVSLYVLTFILHTIVFRSVMRGVYNECIRFVATSILFIFLIALLGDFYNMIGFSFFILSISRILKVIVIMGLLTMQLVTLIYGIKKSESQSNKKWLYIACFVPIIGAIFYLSMNRN